MIAGMMFSGTGAFAQEVGAKKPAPAKTSEKKPEKKKDAPKPDPTKVDVDPASGIEFPIRKLLPGWKVEPVGNLPVGEPFPRETVTHWVHSATRGNWKLRIVRYANPGFAYASFSTSRYLSTKAFGKSDFDWLVIDRFDGSKTGKPSWGQADFWTDSETGRLIFPLETDTKTVIAFLETLKSGISDWHRKLPTFNEEVEPLPVVLGKLPEPGRKSGTECLAYGPSGLSQVNLALQWKGRLENMLKEFPTPPGAIFASAEYSESAPFAFFLIGDYPTPQEATAAFDEVQKYIAGLPEAERQTRRVYRQGNFIIEAFGVRDEKAAAATVKKIEYDYVVRWLGDKPDRATGDNRLTAQQAGQVVVGTFRLVFYAVILMAVVGLVVGMFYFRWRKRHAGEGFVEADAMLRLNLNDDFSLPPASPVKRLSSGE